MSTNKYRDAWDTRSMKPEHTKRRTWLMTTIAALAASGVVVVAASIDGNGHPENLPSQNPVATTPHLTDLDRIKNNVKAIEQNNSTRQAAEEAGEDPNTVGEPNLYPAPIEK